MEPGIGQDDHRVDKLSNQRLNMRVVDVRGGTIPGTNQTPLVQYETQLATHNPPMITLAFLTNLGRAASFPHGMDQLDPIGIRDAQHGGGGQKPGGPRRVHLEEPCQARALWHLQKERRLVARQPAVEDRVPPPLMAYSRAKVTTSLGESLASGAVRDLQPLLVVTVQPVKT